MTDGFASRSMHHYQSLHQQAPKEETSYRLHGHILDAINCIKLLVHERQYK